MGLNRDVIESIIYGAGNFRRFTQDSPILPDVWIAYGEKPNDAIDLLLTPHNESSAGELSRELRARLSLERNTGHWRRLHGEPREPTLVYNESYVLTQLFFDELVRAALPLSNWWKTYIWGRPRKGQRAANLKVPKIRRELAEQLAFPDRFATQDRFAEDLLQFIPVVGAIERERQFPSADHGSDKNSPPSNQKQELEIQRERVEAFWELIADMDTKHVPKGPKLWSVSRNRVATRAIWRSTLSVKADAAIRLFNLKCSELRWAVVDSGIDATHRAFIRRSPGGKARKPTNKRVKDNGSFDETSRVVKTYDFTRLLTILNEYKSDKHSALDNMPLDVRRDLENDLRRSLQSGRAINWELLEPFLRIPHDDQYRKEFIPKSEHGTHVAGILAADMREDDKTPPDKDNLVGVCPDLELYDLRVLGPNGEGDEFTVIAALQFVRYLNASKDELVIHGVNISMSLPHDVANYACGRTPVCEECERLVASGVVVVAAAGNGGYYKYYTAERGFTENYRNISVTDPGNADGVITVGSTHRFMPHTYGVSYFSSRGPTGDGRLKPDLVAPGEKIKSSIPHNNTKTLDGTSMATPHVSGAAALLMARHRELIGQPARIKQILCKTATDLGREHSFQGRGMLDVLRALQSV